MTDKQYRGLRRLIDKLCKKWLNTLGFRRWSVRTTIYRVPKEESPDCVASCDAQWEYMNMWLKFYGPKCLELTEKEFEESFVHECIHGLVNEMRAWGDWEDGKILKSKSDEGMMHEERVVTQLTQAILWANYDGKQEGMKTKRRKK